jgi:alkylation response protein AidB-like acyl-CoA dehydrogenase
MSISAQLGPEVPVGHALSLAPLSEFRAQLRAWLLANAGQLVDLTAPRPDYEARVVAARGLQRVLYEAGWARFGWPTWSGGLGGSSLHRGIVYEELSGTGWHGPAIFEHVEIIAPTLLAYARPEFVAEALPRFLDGTRSWAQGFSEPDAGSDLASLRTRGVVDGDTVVVTGQKLWTSWAKWGHSCLALVRTGTAEERHRGLTMLAIDLDAPGVDVRPIEQVNGTPELAEVTGRR